MQHPIKKYSSKVQLARQCYFPPLTALLGGVGLRQTAAAAAVAGGARPGEPRAGVSEFTVTLAALSCLLIGLETSVCERFRGERR